MKFCYFYYPVVLAVYVLAMFTPGLMRPGVASAVMVTLTAAELLIRAVKERSFGLHKTEDVVMGAWLVFNLLSGIWCVGSGMPISVYLGEVFTTALPMLFYFCGRTDGENKSFYRNFLISTALTGLLGILLFITGPEFYIDHLMRLELISKADVSTMRVRMHSVVGSTLMGYLAAVGMPLSVRLFIGSREKRQRILSIVSFLFMLFLSFMSNQRSAMAAAIFIILYLNFLVFFVYKLFPKKFFALECGLIAAFAAGLFIIFRSAFMKVYYRLVSLPGSVAQRSDQWVGAANNMKNIWLGNGLGANGHRAIGYTEHLIADGGIAKLYVESGIIGTSIFVFLMLLILSKGLKKPGLTAPENGVIIAVLLMSVGSNMMSFALAVPVFYYCAGRCVSLYSGEYEAEAGAGRIRAVEPDKREEGVGIYGT